MGSTVMMTIGAIKIIVILTFLVGLWKRYTYGFVMLAACATLYVLRDLDVKFTNGK